MLSFHNQFYHYSFCSLNQRSHLPWVISLNFYQCIFISIVTQTLIIIHKSVTPWKKAPRTKIRRALIVLWWNQLTVSALLPVNNGLFSHRLHSASLIFTFHSFTIFPFCKINDLDNNISQIAYIVHIPFPHATEWAVSTPLPCEWKIPRKRFNLSTVARNKKEALAPHETPFRRWRVWNVCEIAIAQYQFFWQARNDLVFDFFRRSFHPKIIHWFRIALRIRYPVRPH